MNITIPYSWLQDYANINMPIKKVAQYLSLRSFNVETINRVDGDYIFEIEVTPNRGDALSILGIARELYAILPSKKVKAKKILNQNKIPSFDKTKKHKDKLEVIIQNKNLVPRFSALVMDNVQIANSPKLIANRLKKVGFEPINNIVDITNYLMIDKGQPMHAFDYDKILGHEMILRESQKNEKIVTLDNVERTLPQGVIVIEDGSGRLIDLCGIMGGKNSEIDIKTKKILLFVQIYHPGKIRKASMSLGHRTDAALRFEKGIDHAGVLPALWEAVNMAKKYANANISSPLIDILNKKQKTKIINISYKKINSLAGLNIPKIKTNKILRKLGFNVNNSKVTIPSWRHDDIDINQDLAEEVIRVLGYHNLPTQLPSGEIPKTKKDDVFYWENIIKNFLKHAGFYECYTYSTTSKKNAGHKALQLINPLTEKLTSLKTSLIPQLLEVVKKNQSFSEIITVFEIGNVYLPNTKGSLPKQPLMLGIATKGLNYLKLKGIIEALLTEIGIPNDTLQINIHKNAENDTLYFEINFTKLLKNATRTKTYTPITSFNLIKEDLTFNIHKNLDYQQIKHCILNLDDKIEKLKFKTFYKNFLTISIEYLDKDKQITSQDVKKIRQNILKTLQNKFKIDIKN